MHGCGCAVARLRGCTVVRLHGCTELQRVVESGGGGVWKVVVVVVMVVWAIQKNTKTKIKTKAIFVLFGKTQKEQRHTKESRHKILVQTRGKGFLGQYTGFGI